MPHKGYGVEGIGCYFALLVRTTRLSWWCGESGGGMDGEKQRVVIRGKNQ
jgi:hypothetical protein